MKYRKLRIAFSAVCGIICLLLIALWVRGYWWVEAIRYPAQTNRGRIQLVSIPGRFGIGEIRPVHQKSFYRQSVSEWRAVMATDPTPPELPSQLLGGWMNTKNVDLIFLPCWLVVMSTGIIGTAPWLRWRFSLRTLLIGMTLVAVVLGVIIALNPKQTPRIEVENLRGVLVP